METLKKYIPIVLVLLLTFFAIKPLFISGFFPMHDDTQVARVFEMAKSLKDGMFPVRWVSDLGYGFGYPIFNFYAPLAYYIGGLLMLFGIGALPATKIMIAISMLLSGIFIFLLAKEWWGKLGGIISTLFYVYAPYHALDLYVRGSISELYAYAFVPLFFYCLYKTLTTSQRMYSFIGAIGFSCIILSHNLTALMLIPFVILFVFIFYPHGHVERVKNLSRLFIIGLLIASFYFVPAILEMKYTNVSSQIGGGADFKDHFVCLSQLWDSPWGYGGSVKGCVDGMSFKIGKLHLLVTFVGVLLFVLLLKAKEKYISSIYYRNSLYIFIGFIFSVFMCLEISKPIWDVISPLKYLQYPWRFLLFTSFFSSLFAGSIPWFLSQTKYNRYVWYGIGVIVVVLLYSNIKLFKPQTILSVDSGYYTSDEMLMWKTSKISDEYMPKDFKTPKDTYGVAKDTIQAVGGFSQITDISKNTTRVHAKIYASKPTPVLIQLAYFPALHAYIDGKKTSLTVEQRGLTISVPQGRHVIDVLFEQTFIEQLANAMSITGVSILIVGIILERKRGRVV